VEPCSKGALEAAISKRMVQFEKEHIGRGPSDVRTHIFEDVIFVRLQGILTRAEVRMVGTAEGHRFIKEMRRHLMETSHDELVELITELTGGQVVNLYTDLSPQSGEEIIVFTLDQNLEDAWRSSQTS